MHVDEYVETIRDAVGEKELRGLNERVSRLNLLFNRSKAIVTDPNAVYKLRFRQSVPIQLAISTVTVFQNNAGEEGVKTIKLSKSTILDETWQELHRRFGTEPFNAYVYAHNYWQRLLDRGFLVQVSADRYSLADDFDSRMIFLIANSNHVSEGNNYAKAMTATVACQGLTER